MDEDAAPAPFSICSVVSEPVIYHYPAVSAVIQSRLSGPTKCGSPSGFALNGRYGNKVSEQLPFRGNPHARLCGSIVKEALQKEVMSFAEGEMT